MLSIPVTSDDGTNRGKNNENISMGEDGYANLSQER